MSNTENPTRVQNTIGFYTRECRVLQADKLITPKITTWCFWGGTTEPHILNRKSSNLQLCLWRQNWMLLTRPRDNFQSCLWWQKIKLLTGSSDDSRHLLLKKRVFSNKILGRFPAVWWQNRLFLTHSSDTFQPKHWDALTETSRGILAVLEVTKNVCLEQLV